MVQQISLRTYSPVHFAGNPPPDLIPVEPIKTVRVGNRDVRIKIYCLELYAEESRRDVTDMLQTLKPGEALLIGRGTRQIRKDNPFWNTLSTQPNIVAAVSVHLDYFSRAQTVIVRNDDGTFTLTDIRTSDLPAQNGTFVNGKKVTQGTSVVLKPHNAISVNTKKFYFTIPH